MPPFVSIVFKYLPMLITLEGELTLTLPNTPPRRPGAPLGNTNALKHGFYSRRFRKSELTDLEAASFTGLSEEIAMLRVCIRRVIEWGRHIESFPDALSFLRVISLAAASLSRLVHTQKALTSPDANQFLLQAVEEVAREMGFVPGAQGGDAEFTPDYKFPSFTDDA